MYEAVTGLSRFELENRLSIIRSCPSDTIRQKTNTGVSRDSFRRRNVPEAGELFKYLVSKQVESIDGLQSSFSQAHRAAEIRRLRLSGFH